jgi:hypothetical protein
MVVILVVKVEVLRSRARRDGFLAKGRGDALLGLVAQRSEGRAGLRLSREDALDRNEREGAETSGAGQGLDQVLAFVDAEEAEDTMGLFLAVATMAHEAIEEDGPVFPEIRERSQSSA